MKSIFQQQFESNAINSKKEKRNYQLVEQPSERLP
jgi:hypothetical protein